MGWRQEFRSYFTFNNREKRGISILLLLLLCLVSVHLWLRFSPSAELDYQAIYHETSHVHVSHSSKINKTGTLDTSFNWNDFNPNSASVDDYVASGLDRSVADRVVKYRSKAGDFDSIQALEKIFGMDMEWLALLKENVEEISKVDAERNSLHTTAPSSAKKEVRPQRKSIDLNRADTLQLLQIPGVGKFYAKEVVKLRERLGGYYSYDQLLEIYKIRDETITAISEYTFIDTNAVRKMNINVATVETLGRHPYLGWKPAKVIVSYRQQHGPYMLKTDILKTMVVSDSVYRNIAPYLIVQ